MSSFKDIDHGYRRLTHELKASDGLSVTVGIQGPTALATSYDDTQATNVQVAATQELGWPEKNIPRRSFLRDTVDANQVIYGLLISKLLARMVKSKGKFTADQALNLLGARVSADARRRIRAGIAPDLAASTILWRARQNKGVATKLRRGRKKGKSLQELAGSFTPLINTGTLMNSITWLVRKNFRGRTL